MIRIEFPEDVRKIILLKQAEIKIDKKMKSYSQQLTVFKIVREWKEMIDAKKPS